MSSRPAPRTLVAVALVVAGVLVVVAWSLRGGGTSDPAAAGTEPTAGTSTDGSSSDAVVPSHRLPGRPTRPSPYAGVPLRLVVPALDIDAPVERIGVTDGTLTPPDDPQVLGWWKDGAVPGAARGGALITGHTVHTGGGAMDDLETLRGGDRVTVVTRKGDVGYRVQDVTVYRKATLAQDAARLFSQQRPGRLVLITCEDWDGTRYLSNVVAIGRPV